MDTEYSLNNERTRIGGWGLGIQKWIKNINKFQKWVQEDAQDIIKPDNKIKVIVELSVICVTE